MEPFGSKKQVTLFSVSLEEREPVWVPVNQDISFAQVWTLLLELLLLGAFCLVREM